MKVNYQERINLTVVELKRIISQQKTATNRQKIQVLYWLKSGYNQGITDVAQRLGVHRVTVQRWLKQYSEGGVESLLKVRPRTGRPRVIPSTVLAGISEKLNQEDCDFKSYKEIGKWVEEKYQIKIKYPTLHNQIYSRMKAKLKRPRRCSIKKDLSAVIEFKKN